MGIGINVSMTNRPRDVSFPLHDATYVIYRAFRRIGRPSRMRTSNIITEVDYCVPCILIFWHLLKSSAILLLDIVTQRIISIRP